MTDAPFRQIFLNKEFLGMKYPFKECARPILLKHKLCHTCSVSMFCQSPERKEYKNA